MIDPTEKPFAIIYPIPHKFVTRILDQKKSIFVKYNTQASIPSRLMDCKKILIYESGSGKAVVGECDILFIELMSLSKVLSEHRDDLFLDEEELRAYSKGRDKKEMLVFKIHNIEKYSLPKVLDHRLTMAGEYISENAYLQLMKKS
jgi:hypothetical protein